MLQRRKGKNGHVKRLAVLDNRLATLDIFSKGLPEK